MVPRAFAVSRQRSLAMRCAIDPLRRIDLQLGFTAERVLHSVFPRGLSRTGAGSNITTTTLPGGRQPRRDGFFVVSYSCSYFPRAVAHAAVRATDVVPPLDAAEDLTPRVVSRIEALAHRQLRFQRAEERLAHRVVADRRKSVNVSAVIGAICLKPPWHGLSYRLVRASRGTDNVAGLLRARRQPKIFQSVARVFNTKRRVKCHFGRTAVAPARCNAA